MNSLKAFTTTYENVRLGKVKVKEINIKGFASLAIPIEDLLKDLRIFLFPEIKEDIEASRVTPDRSVLDKGLGLPFTKCWFECLTDSGHICGPYSAHLDALLCGALIIEVSPDLFDIYTLERVANNSHYAIGFYRGVTHEQLLAEPVTQAFQLALFYILSMYKDDMVTEKGDGVIMLRNPDRPHKKKPFHINQIIRVYPRHEKDFLKPVLGNGKFDFTHRFEVRGHWRKVSAIGKDRDGVYQIPGFTWVKDFVKGPEDQPIAKKTRLFLEQPKT